MKRIFKNPLTWVFIIAVGVRLYLGAFTAVVNPDGLIYIQQARAIYFHQWSAINACGMKYLSILPPLIAVAFAVFRDWVVAGRFVALIFSCGMFVPLYFILKRFFDARITRLTLLVYAFIPALAGRSAEIIRGPIFWFFLLTAFWMVLRHHDTRDGNRPERNKGLNLILACLFFMLAAWARIESILYLCITAGYLLYREKGRRIQSLTRFLLPLFVMAAMGIVAALALDLPLARLFRLDKPAEVLTHFMDGYHDLRVSLDGLANAQHGLVAEFLNQAGKFAWIVPLGPFLDCLAEKFFYPYLLIFLLGFAGLRQRVKADPRIVYFIWLCLGATAMLYLYILKTWLIYDRFLTNLILPAVLIVGFGCQNSVQWLTAQWRISPKRAAIVLAVGILAFGLGKNAHPRYAEKAIFPKMAEAIVNGKAPGERIRIAAGRSNAYDWVFFYVNRDVSGALCDQTESVAIGKGYPAFLSRLKNENIRYVLWSKKTWPRGSFDLMTEPWKTDFETVGKWNYDGKEDYLLLRLKAE